MPRELVHWRVVQAALEHPKIQASKALFSSLHREKLSVYLGALAHDVPYYYRAGHDPFEKVADYLHGRDGEDTFDPVRLLANAILARPQNEQICLWPFLFGMLSHMAADIVFHPMIFYFTGNYHAHDPLERKRAQARHRMLEVYLESWIRPQVRFSWGSSLRTLLVQNRASNNEVIARLLDSALTPETLWPLEFPSTSAPSRWASGFSQLAFYQGLFVSLAVGAPFRLASMLSGTRLKGIDALFNFGRTKPEKIFDAPFAFRNPVSGENSESSVEQMITESIELTVDFILLFEPLISGETTDVEAVLGNVVGSSLNFGIPHAKVDLGLFFSEQGIPLRGLRHG